MKIQINTKEMVKRFITFLWMVEAGLLGVVTYGLLTFNPISIASGAAWVQSPYVDVWQYLNYMMAVFIAIICMEYANIKESKTIPAHQ